MRQCKGRTRHGDQCRNKAIPGTISCYIRAHSKTPQIFLRRAVNYLWNRWPGITTTIFLFTTALGLYWHWQDKKSHAWSGVLTSSSGKSSQFPILSVSILHIMLASPNGVFLTDGKEPLLSLKVEGNRLLVSTVIRNEKGDLVAELKDNEWAVQQPPAIFDRNYTDDLLEVRNSAGSIALQVVNLGETIHVAGIFHCRNGWTTVMGTNGFAGALFDVRPPGVASQHKIPSICEYPSASHFGSCPGLESLKSLINAVPPGTNYVPLITPVNVCVKGEPPNPQTR
jgi:hypothetical protein